MGTEEGLRQKHRWRHQELRKFVLVMMAMKWLDSSAYYVSQLVQSLSHVRLFMTPWIAACRASLSITNSQSSHKPTSIESVMLSNHLILCRPLLLPSILPQIRVFSNESVLHIKWPKYWNFSFSNSPSNEYSELISFSTICVFELPTDYHWMLSKGEVPTVGSPQLEQACPS